MWQVRSPQAACWRVVPHAAPSALDPSFEVLSPGSSQKPIDTVPLTARLKGGMVQLDTEEWIAMHNIAPQRSWLNLGPSKMLSAYLRDLSFVSTNLSQAEQNSTVLRRRIQSVAQRNRVQ
jgi:hypothetical protein